jgi:hypothetical protein
MARPLEQDVPKGPLAVRWHRLEPAEFRAGAATSVRVELENAGTTTWRSEGEAGVHLAYHWLDERGNPIVWDGVRSALERPVGPGEQLRETLAIRGPIPPGRYRLALDLVDEGRAWFAELGNAPLETECEVGPRIARALAARGGDAEALAAQEEPLVGEEEAEAVAFLADGVVPAPDWSRRVLDAHQEGYAVVGGSVEAEASFGRRRPRELEPYAPGGGRAPTFPYPLVCPSAVAELALDWADEVAGLPAVRPPADEPWLYDGRIRARLRSGRPRG